MIYAAFLTMAGLFAVGARVAEEKRKMDWGQSETTSKH